MLNCCGLAVNCFDDLKCRNKHKSTRAELFAQQVKKDVREICQQHKQQVHHIAIRYFTAQHTTTMLLHNMMQNAIPVESTLQHTI